MKNYEIPLEAVKSSVISKIGYNPEEEKLRIVFKSGLDYVYRGVPKATFQGLRRAKSKGRYMNDKISQTFNYSKVLQG